MFYQIISYLLLPLARLLEPYFVRKAKYPQAWLMHWIGRTGSKLVLPAPFAAMQEFRAERLSKQLRRTNSGWEMPHDGDELGRSDFFHTVGKYRWRLTKVDGGHLYSLLDRYLFYPTCSSSYDHGANCGCIRRNWNEIQLGQISFPIRWMPVWLQHKINATHQKKFGPFRWDASCIYNFQGEYKVKRIAGVTICAETSDRIFEKMGKPFYTTWHTFVPERQFEK